MDIFDNVYPYINGALISKATQVQTGLVSDKQRVMTLAEGFAGWTPSPHVREITVENVVPIGGIEFEVERYMLEETIVTMKLQFGGSGQVYEGKGGIFDVKIDAGVGKTTSLSFTFVGEGKAFA